jgi:hypothetical protein
MAPERVQVLEAYRKARNQMDYRGVPVSDAVARECVEEAARLLADVRARIEARHKRSGAALAPAHYRHHHGACMLNFS